MKIVLSWATCGALEAVNLLPREKPVKPCGADHRGVWFEGSEPEMAELCGVLDRLGRERDLLGPGRSRSVRISARKLADELGIARRPPAESKGPGEPCATLELRAGNIIKIIRLWTHYE